MVFKGVGLYMWMNLLHVPQIVRYNCNQQSIIKWCRCANKYIPSESGKERRREIKLNRKSKKNHQKEWNEMENDDNDSLP